MADSQPHTPDVAAAQPNFPPAPGQGGQAPPQMELQNFVGGGAVAVPHFIPLNLPQPLNLDPQFVDAATGQSPQPSTLHSSPSTLARERRGAGLVPGYEPQNLNTSLDACEK